MTPYYQDDLVTLYCGDYRDVLGMVSFDAVVTDPPYGIKWKPRVNHRESPWVDSERHDLEPVIADRWACVWGGNYYADQLPVSNGWLIWLKRPSDGSFDGDTRTFSTVELAWTNFGTKPRVKTFVWDGGKREGDTQNRMFCHPAQKPIEIMRWCVGLIPEPVECVFDPFAGSGTTLVAAKQLGQRCVGVELQASYCDVAVDRLRQGSLMEIFR